MRRILTLWLPALFWGLLLALPTARAEREFLRPDQAFSISGRAEGQTILVKWRIADDYYLYKTKFRFSTETGGIELGIPRLPAAEIKQDQFFGNIEIYRGEIEVEVPYSLKGTAPEIVELQTRSQGCAEDGICYPPHTQNLLIALSPEADAPPPVAATAAAAMAESIASSGAATPTSIESGDSVPETQPEPAGGNALAELTALGQDLGLPEDDVLPVEQAFVFQAEALDGNTLGLRWDIAEGVYLYRDKIRIELESADVRLGDYSLPQAEIKHDTITPEGEIGDVAVYHNQVDLNLPLLRSTAEPGEINLKVSFQGCAERGICYPPVRKSLVLNLPAGTAAGTASTSAAPAPAASAPVAAPRGTAPEAEQDRLARLISEGNMLLIFGAFFLIGLGLAFTPCVFPMIPILSGIIAGQGRNISTRLAFMLSLVYVLAMAVTYTLAGVAAGMFGANLQAAFQNPWILSGFALVFVALALSMFGFYNLQLPASWQSRLSDFSNRQEGGTLTGAAIMGLLSALIVGPCVAPPLAAALIYIGQTGDPVLGGLALFAMSLGMGAPLLAIGTSAGKVLPRAGAWMDAVKGVFGVLMLGVAIYLLERIIPESASMLLWGLLLLVSGIYMGALDPLAVEASGWAKLWKGLGLALVVYGGSFLIGVAAGGHDTLQPLRGVLNGAGGGSADAGEQHLAFKRIKSTADLDRELAAARAAGKPVMLDFYADWCTYCKQMERNTFPDPGVRQALADFVLLQADVTDQDEDDLALQKQIGIPAPPAMIFWGRDGVELAHLRLLGFEDAADFANHVMQVQ